MEKLNLKVEKELDRLRGEFRKKEAAMMQKVKEKIRKLESLVHSQSNDNQQTQHKLELQDQTIQMQDQTVSFILNAVGSLTQLLHASVSQPG